MPCHPGEGELILADSGERLLSRPVTTTLGPHSWGRHTESQCSKEKNRTRGRIGKGWGRRRGEGDREDLHAWLFSLCHPEDSGGVGFMIAPEKVGGIQRLWRILTVSLFWPLCVIHPLVVRPSYVILGVLSGLINSSGEISPAQRGVCTPLHSVTHACTQHFLIGAMVAHTIN